MVPILLATAVGIGVLVCLGITTVLSPTDQEKVFVHIAQSGATLGLVTVVGGGINLILAEHNRTLEFQVQYRPISRLQEGDEALNKARREALDTKTGTADEYASSVSDSAWKALEKLERLKGLRLDTEYEREYKPKFVDPLDAASACLRRRLPGGQLSPQT
jgi:hypothetical protein